ncbi:MAG: N-acetylmuramate alpha-1-phosphate uridylyltransferase MurU [Polynucleobacter victoriensis]
MHKTQTIPCMVLAAGRGERMRPLTDHTPKPLLQVKGKALIDWHIDGLATNHLTNVVINHAWLGEKIIQHFSQDRFKKLNIQLSAENEALETAGGLRQAMPLMKIDDYFFAINGDVFCPQFPFERILEITNQLRKHKQPPMAYLFLTQNPSHHPEGDFQLNGNLVTDKTSSSINHTFSGAGLYHQDLFKSIKMGSVAKLAPILRSAMSENLVLGEMLNVLWVDVGTPERLAELNSNDNI